MDPFLMFLKREMASRCVRSWHTCPLIARISSPVERSRDRVILCHDGSFIMILRGFLKKKKNAD